MNTQIQELAAKVNLEKVFGNHPETIIACKIALAVEADYSNERIIEELEARIYWASREMKDAVENFESYEAAKANGLQKDWHTLRGQSRKGAVTQFAQGQAYLNVCEQLITYLKKGC